MTVRNIRTAIAAALAALAAFMATPAAAQYVYPSVRTYLKQHCVGHGWDCRTYAAVPQQPAYAPAPAYRESPVYRRHASKPRRVYGEARTNHRPHQVAAAQQRTWPVRCFTSERGGQMCPVTPGSVYNYTSPETGRVIRLTCKREQNTTFFLCGGWSTKYGNYYVVRICDDPVQGRWFKAVHYGHNGLRSWDPNS